MTVNRDALSVLIAISDRAGSWFGVKTLAIRIGIDDDRICGICADLIEGGFIEAIGSPVGPLFRLLDMRWAAPTVNL